MEELESVPFLVLGNKIDCPEAVSEEALRYELGLVNTTRPNHYIHGNRPLEVFMCSFALRQGKYGRGEGCIGKR